MFYMTRFKNITRSIIKEDISNTEKLMLNCKNYVLNFGMHTFLSFKCSIIISWNCNIIIITVIIINLFKGYFKSLVLVLQHELFHTQKAWSINFCYWHRSVLYVACRLFKQEARDIRHKKYKTNHAKGFINSKRPQHGCLPRSFVVSGSNISLLLTSVLGSF